MVSAELLSGPKVGTWASKVSWSQWVLGLQSLPEEPEAEGVWCGTPALHILPSSWLFSVKCVFGTYCIQDQALG